MTKRKTYLTVIAILILAFGAANFVYPKYFDRTVDYLNTKLSLSLPHFQSMPFKFGLDLQGGSRLIYEADLSNIQENERVAAIEGVRDVIERRVNTFGVSEPRVATSRVGDKWRLVVELPNVNDVNQALGWIGETPLLEFKEENPLPELTPEQQQEMETANSVIREEAAKILAEALKEGADFSALAKTYSEDPGSAEKGGDLDWFAKGVMVPEFEKPVFEELKDGETDRNLVETSFGYHIIKKVGTRLTAEGTEEVQASHILFRKKVETDYIDFSQWEPWKYTGLGGEHLKTARLELDPNTGLPQVALEFKQKGTELFAEITARNVGKSIAIFLDGQSIVDTDGDGQITPADVYAPNVQEAITNGQAVITGNMDINRAKEIVRRLKAGALPVDIGEPIYQKTVGPSLGAVSLQESLTAAIYGLLAVLLFMIIFYRLPGVLASISLMIYAILVLSLFKLIPVTLTLAGLGGIILSIGMAVDANVLIFSRIREELKEGNSFSSSLEEGFRRAWPSIRDGNLTTLFVAFILFSFGSSFVQGFALTLSLGVLVSMFSAIFITKKFMEIFRGTIFENWKWLWR
ncbi:MAG: protein translocase subunit SecD [bacterium]